MPLLQRITFISSTTSFLAPNGADKKVNQTLENVQLLILIMYINNKEHALIRDVNHSLETFRL